MKKLLFLSLLLSLYVPFVNSEEVKAVSEPVTVKPFMQDFYISLKNLEPYIIDSTKFKSEKSSEQLSQMLSEFANQTKKLKQEKISEKSDMSVKIQLLVDGLNESAETFKNGYKDYSYWVLKSSLRNCYACHASKGLPQTEYKLSDIKDGSDYMKASFLYLVRNYSISLPLFEKIITEYPKNNLSLSELNEAVDKLLTYYTKVETDRKKASEVFKRLSQLKELPVSMQVSMAGWSRYFEQNQIDNSVLFKNEKEMKKYLKNREKIADKYSKFSESKVVDFDTSRVLFSNLDKTKNNKLKPWLMYELANIDKDYRMSLFDASPELYLKECIERYSQSAAARKCFDLYKEIKTLSFTGSEGVTLPQSVIDQFKKYEKLLKK